MDNRTVTIQRANVILRVPEDEVEKYYSKGYDILDNNGNVVKASVPNDLGTLQKAYIDRGIIIEELEREIADLKKQLKAKTRAVKSKGGES